MKLSLSKNSKAFFIATALTLTVSNSMAQAVSGTLQAGVGELNNTSTPSAIRFAKQRLAPNYESEAYRYQMPQGQTSFKSMIGTPTGKNYEQNSSHGPLYFQPLASPPNSNATQWISFNLRTLNYVDSSASTSNSHIAIGLKARGDFLANTPQYEALGMIFYKNGQYFSQPKSAFIERFTSGYGYNGAVIPDPSSQQFELRDTYTYTVTIHAAGTYVAYWIFDPRTNVTYNFSANTSDISKAFPNPYAPPQVSPSYGTGIFIGLVDNNDTSEYQIDITNISTGWF